MPAGPTLDPGRAYSIARHPDGRTVAFGDLDGLISQWDEPTAKRLKASADPPTVVTELHFSPDGKKVRGWARGWYEWDVATGKQVRRSPPIPNPAGIAVVGSRDLRWLAVEKPVTNGFRIELNDMATGASREIPETFHTHASFRFLPTDRLLVEQVARLSVFDPTGGEPAIHFPGARDNREVAVSADGTQAAIIAVGQTRFRLDRYDLRGRELGKWVGDVPDVKPLDRTTNWRAMLSPDGGALLVRYIHISNRDVTFDEGFILDTSTGQRLSGWSEIHGGTTLFRPDGRSVLSWWGRLQSFKLRETRTGEVRATIEHRRPAREACYHPDGQRLAVSTGPHPVEIWDLFGDPGPWDGSAAGALWTALADPNAAHAFPLIRQVWAHPAEGVAFLRRVGHRSRSRTTGCVRLKGVDAPAFRDREKATAALIAVAELVEARLRAALPAASPEARERIEKVLKVAAELTPDRLRQIRACEALEGAGTPEALGVLKRWAAGPPESTLTREAKASVGRMKSDRGK